MSLIDPSTFGVEEKKNKMSKTLIQYIIKVTSLAFSHLSLVWLNLHPMESNELEGEAEV